MEIELRDRVAIIRVAEQTSLVLSDLHLGIESEFSTERGVTIPPQDHSMLARIEKLIETEKASRIYIIGDIKHTIATDSEYNWRIIPQFMESLIDKADISIIPGNHDGNLEPLLPRSIRLEDSYGIRIIGEEVSVGLLHGHTWPATGLLTCKLFIIGHNHPTLRRIKSASVPEIGRPRRKRFRSSIPVYLKSPIDKNCVRRRMKMSEDQDDAMGTLVTLPSFSLLPGGVSVNIPDTRFRGPFFTNKCADILQSEVYSADEVYLGTVQSLRQRYEMTR